MEVARIIEGTGGGATRAQLIAATSRREFDQALKAGVLIRVARGRFTSPSTAAAAAIAWKLGGFLCLADAAVRLGWEVVRVDSRPHVLVPQGNRVAREARLLAHVHRGRLGPDDVLGLATGPDRTLDMCGRNLPFPEALAIADSALRHGYSQRRMQALALAARGPGAARLRTVATHADGRSANPFESALRAHCWGIDGLRLVPQSVIALPTGDVRPDLVDPDLRLVMEADSFEFHGHRSALHADTVRYNALVAQGWTVLRFSYEQVMGQPELVRSTVENVVRRLAAA